MIVSMGCYAILHSAGINVGVQKTADQSRLLLELWNDNEPCDHWASNEFENFEASAKEFCMKALQTMKSCPVT